MQTLIQKVWNPGEMVLLTEPQAKSTPAVQRPLKKEALQFGERLAPEGSRKRSADLTHPRVPGLGPNPSTLTILTFKAEPLGTRILGVIRYPRPPPRPALQPHGGAARPPARIWGSAHARARGAMSMRERAGAGAVGSVAAERRLPATAASGAAPPSPRSGGRSASSTATDRARRRRSPRTRSWCSSAVAVTPPPGPGCEAGPVSPRRAGAAWGPRAPWRACCTSGPTT